MIDSLDFSNRLDPSIVVLLKQLSKCLPSTRLTSIIFLFHHPMRPQKRKRVEKAIVLPYERAIGGNAHGDLLTKRL